MSDIDGLISAIYSQYWPANLPKKQSKVWSIDGRFEKRGGAERTTNGASRGYHGLTRDVQSARKPEVRDVRRQCWEDAVLRTDDDKEQIIDVTLDSMTKAEFRRLREQIRDVSASLGYKFRGSGYRNYVQKDENNPILYRSQLADSMKTFRLQTRPPLQPETKKAELSRCRPIIGTKPIWNRPQTAPPASCLTQPRPHRPQSAVPSDAEVGRSSYYDTLNSELIYNLANKEQIDSGYGDQVLTGDEGDSSDDEAIPEPEVDENRKIPEFPALRPDPLESMYMSEGERDYQKYDFDATKVDIPKYEFKYSGPEEFEKVDFEDLASYGKDWRLMTKRRPQDTELELLIDKFIELERLVVKTEDWEDRRREKCRQLGRQKQITAYNLRAQGRRVGSARKDKRCCKNCLQPACVGDCPLKKTSVHFCIHCRQEFCSGHCIHLSYNSYSRMTASESDSDSETAAKPVRKARPKSCQSCRRLDTNAKAINTNQILQGRPKSSLATFNRGKSSVETKELISEDHDCHPVIEEEFQKLNIVPNSRPSTATKRPLHGRAAVIPGKSYFSQRHDSISVPKAERVKSAPPRLAAGARVRRVRSARGRRSRNGSRPGTATERKVPETETEIRDKNIF